MSDDLIRREDAIKMVGMLLDKADDVTDPDERIELRAYNTGVQGAINMIKHHVPSADRPQDDEFKNFDRESLILLIECQKERIGELLADRPQGEWVSDYSSPIAYRCTACNTLQHWSVIQNGRYRFCPNCGAKMKGTMNDETN